MTPAAGPARFPRRVTSLRSARDAPAATADLYEARRVLAAFRRGQAGPKTVALARLWLRPLAHELLAAGQWRLAAIPDHPPTRIRDIWKAAVSSLEDAVREERREGRDWSGLPYLLGRLEHLVGLLDELDPAFLIRWSGQAACRIERDVVEGILAPGRALPLRELVRRYEVPERVAEEARNVLTARGVLLGSRESVRVPDPRPGPVPPREGAAAWAAARLRHQIATGDLAPGQQVRPVVVAEQWGVTRSAASRAVRSLHEIGLLSQDTRWAPYTVAHPRHANGTLHAPGWPARALDALPPPQYRTLRMLAHCPGPEPLPADLATALCEPRPDQPPSASLDALLKARLVQADQDDAITIPAAVRRLVEAKPLTTREEETLHPRCSAHLTQTLRTATAELHHVGDGVADELRAARRVGQALNIMEDVLPRLPPLLATGHGLRAAAAASCVTALRGAGHQILTQAALRAEEREEQQLAARLWSNLAAGTRLTGNLAAARTCAQRAVHLLGPKSTADDPQHRRGLARAEFETALCHPSQAETRAWLHRLQAEHPHETGLAARCLLALAELDRDGGNPDQAAARAQAARALPGADIAVLAHADLITGRAQHDQRDPAARCTLLHARELAREMGAFALHTAILHALAEVSGSNRARAYRRQAGYLEHAWASTPATPAPCTAAGRASPPQRMPLPRP